MEDRACIRLLAKHRVAGLRCQILVQQVPVEFSLCLVALLRFSCIVIIDQLRIALRGLIETYFINDELEEAYVSVIGQFWFQVGISLSFKLVRYRLVRLLVSPYVDGVQRLALLGQKPDQFASLSELCCVHLS